MNSMNHYAYGSVRQWLWETAVGIVPMEPGFVRARVAPQPDWRLRTLDASFDSAVGTWHVAWECVDERHLRMHFVVPFGVVAEVNLPMAAESAYEQLGGHVLSAGTYDITYETTRALWRVPSVDVAISVILDNRKTTQVLRRYVKHADMLPHELRGYSVRQLLSGSPGVPALSDKQLAALDAELREFTE